MEAAAGLMQRLIKREWDEYNAFTRRLDHGDPGYRNKERDAWRRLTRNLKRIKNDYS